LAVFFFVSFGFLLLGSFAGSSTGESFEESDAANLGGKVSVVAAP